MKVTNLSTEPEGLLRSWLPRKLRAEHIIFLPDACPGKSPLPTGTVVLTRQPYWRRFAVSDCGCGMRLLKSSLKPSELNRSLWDRVAVALKENRKGLGHLGGGNHFLDALLPYEEDTLYFLIHTGSRQESGLVDDLVDSPDQFDEEFLRIVRWAESNRAMIQEILEKIVGKTELTLDLPHNTFEKIDGGVIIRKGSVKLNAGDVTILPSHMSGDVVLLRATDKIGEVLFSMAHGTGRTMSRRDAKNASLNFDFDALRKALLMPSSISNSSLNTEGPFAYRDLDDCLELLAGYVEEVKRLRVVAYAGHL